MIIYPAIDLKNGQCVRLYRGDMTQDTVYNDSPVRQALEWQSCGFSYLHIVDLDGAVKGMPVNSHAIRDIIAAVKIPVQLGGGIRSQAHIEHWLEAGVSRVILGSTAVRDPDLVRQACREYPGRIAVGIDARKDRVSVDGWVHDANIGVIELARNFENAGAAAIIYTDIDRDGTGHGVNMASTIELAKATSIPVIASGGVGTMDDLMTVKAASAFGIKGVIVGRAFYDRTIDPREAATLMNGQNA